MIFLNWQFYKLTALELTVVRYELVYLLILRSYLIAKV